MLFDLSTVVCFRGWQVMHSNTAKNIIHQLHRTLLWCGQLWNATYWIGKFAERGLSDFAWKWCHLTVVDVVYRAFYILLWIFGRLQFALYYMLCGNLPDPSLIIPVGYFFIEPCSVSHPFLLLCRFYGLVHFSITFIHLFIVFINFNTIINQKLDECYRLPST